MTKPTVTRPIIFPFAALVGQDSMKLGLILNVINPGLSGVLIRGEKGTGKSTAARALAEILPEIQVVRRCPFQLEAGQTGGELCAQCTVDQCGYKAQDQGEVVAGQRKVRVVELPVGATEDRVVGTMDLERALKEGEKHFEPGLLAAANRGILYVDEVNLLEDHVVDVLLDSAAMGVNTVEREGVSFSHPARFTLVGTMNPEEGELRPQLLDRFGLCVHVEGVADADMRVEVLDRRGRYEDDPEAFFSEYQEESSQLTSRIKAAMELLPQVESSREIMLQVVEFCLRLGTDGHRGDIITHKAAKTLAAWEGRTTVTGADVDAAAELVLPHRIRRRPFEDVAPDLKQVRA